MRISLDQLQDITTARDDAYARRLASFMRRKFPEFAAGYDVYNFDAGVRAGVREGRKWNVRTADGMVAAATLWLLGGSELFAEKNVQVLLSAEGGGEPIDRKMTRLIDRVWQTLEAEVVP